MQFSFYIFHPNPFGFILTDSWYSYSSWFLEISSFLSSVYTALASGEHLTFTSTSFIYTWIMHNLSHRIRTLTLHRTLVGGFCVSKTMNYAITTNAYWNGCSAHDSTFRDLFEYFRIWTMSFRVFYLHCNAVGAVSFLLWWWNAYFLL